MATSVILWSIVLFYCCQADDVWVTSGDQQELLERSSISSGPQGPGSVFQVDTSESDQFIIGFGAAISNAAAYNLYNLTNNRQAVLNTLFHPENGIGITALRLVMGGSDFNAVLPYTYDDVESGEDFEMAEFTVEKDEHFVIPLLKEILEINPDIWIMASPWSPPAWMKNPRSLNGGRLRQGDQYLEALADYFIRFLEEYQERGITIHAITLQNEPDYATGGYPTMHMSWQEQRDIIKDYLGEKMRDARMDTEIWIWDHNWDNTNYATNILDDQDAKQYISGSAWHCYGGDKNDPAEVREAHPDKDLHFTECSGGEWDTHFGSILGWNIENLFLGQTKIGARTVLLWNLALDENHGPREGVSGGCANCRGVITVNSGNGEIELNVEYYSIGHFSKFILPGARRVEIQPINDDWVDVGAYQNPDGSVVVVALNTNWDDNRSYNILVEGEYYTHTLKPRSAATFVLNLSPSIIKYCSVKEKCHILH